MLFTPAGRTQALQGGLSTRRAFMLFPFQLSIQYLPHPLPFLDAHNASAAWRCKRSYL